MNEQKEALMRIVVRIVTGIILGIWRGLTQILAIVNFFIVLFTKKRNKELAELCEVWNMQIYVFLKYMTFVSNKRPFPFSKLEERMSRFER